jgi:hypothetical protein
MILDVPGRQDDKTTARKIAGEAVWQAQRNNRRLKMREAGLCEEGGKPTSAKGVVRNFAPGGWQTSATTVHDF